VRKDAVIGGGSIYPDANKPKQMAVHDGESAKVIAIDPLFANDSLNDHI
jgi:hypothetical protein